MGMITIAFDDGYKSTFDNCAEFLLENNIYATFAVPTHPIGKTLENRPVIGALDIKKLVKMGHEIASHSMGHKNLLDLLTDTDHNEIEKELTGSKVSLESLTSMPIGSFVFPFIENNRNSLLIKTALAHYDTVRVTEYGLNFNNPSLFDTRCFMGSAITIDEDLKTLNEAANTALSKDFWLIEVFHLVSDKNTKSAHRDEPYRFFTHIDVFIEHIEHIISLGIPVIPQQEVYGKYILPNL